jgi:hypothetical protein
MADELFVDVRYRGIELGRRLQIDEVIASQAYLHSPAPMPVGTLLTIDADDDLELTIRVTRVSEQVAGNERPAGMFVEPFELTESAQDRWNAWAGVQGSASDAAPAEAQTAALAEAAEAPASEVAATSSESEAKPKAKKKRSRRKKAK